MSGAPILDSEGRVVAINVSGGKNGGRLQGYGTPLSGIEDAFEGIEKP